MCWVQPRTGYAFSVGGVALCAALCLCSVGIPGWATKDVPVEGGEGESQTVYAGLFWICYNGSVTTTSCVSGDPFGHTAVDVTKLLVLVGLGFQVAGVAIGVCHVFSCCHGYTASRPRSSMVEVLSIGGGLIFFAGGMCAVGYVMGEGTGDYIVGPALFLALASSTLTVNFGCLVLIYNRDPDNRPVFV